MFRYKKNLSIALLSATFFFINIEYTSAQNIPVNLDWSNFDKLVEKIKPKEKEIAWKEIPWRSDLKEAITESANKDLPLLIWAMNGDPLGCT